MSNIRTAMNRGAFDFLTKPIDFPDFEATIAKTIRHIEVLREARRRQAEAERASFRVTSRPIWLSGLPATRTRLILGDSVARSQRCSPTLPASPRSWRRSNRT